MARSKRRVKNRSKLHRSRVAAGVRMRSRRRARGVTPPSKKRKRRAARRMAKNVKPA